MTRCIVACAVMIAAANVGMTAEPVSVAVTVAEPAGVARKADAAFGGVPFKKGQVKELDELALVDKDGKAVPAQFSKLAAYEDGSVQWALVDFALDLPAKGTATYTVKSGAAAAPAMPLKIAETDTAVTVETGIAAFVVNKASFNVLDAVTVGAKKAAGPGAMTITDVGGATYAAAKPAKVAWEYKGPLRATLRVDGPFVGEGGKEFLAYTVRLTFRAGNGAVKIEHSIRNSNPKEGDDAQIKGATVAFDLAVKGEQGKGENWFAAGDATASVLVAHRHTGGCFPGGGLNSGNKPTKGLYKQDVADGRVTAWAVPPAPGGKAPRGYGDTFFALADVAHKDTELWLDVATGARDAAALQARVRGLFSYLHALADPRWMSETEALGCGRFGTLDDEVATYKAWGWKGIDDPKKRASTVAPHVPDDFLEYVPIHFDSEADSAELGLLMYVRTGQRGFLDRGEAYARYFKTHYIFRSDGFAYDGWRHGHVSSGLAAKSKRPVKGQFFDWRSPSVYGWAESRWCYCHFWGAGLFDYYCLTGDVDALEGGLDTAEIAELLNSRATPGAPLTLSRNWGREFMAITRAWQVTRDPRWKTLADRFAAQVKQAPNRDPSGLYRSINSLSIQEYLDAYFGPAGKGGAPEACRKYIQDNGITYKYDKTKGEVWLTDKAGKTWQLWESAQSFELAASVDAIARYAEVMGDAEMAKAVAGIAEGVKKHYWSEKCQHHTPYFHHPHIGMPVADKVYDEADWTDLHKGCPNGDGGKHSGYHSRYMADIFAYAYTATGDKAWLDWAKKAWNRGTKRGYWTTKQSVPDDEVASFAGHIPPKGDGVDIRSCLRTFSEVPRAAKAK